MGGGRSRVPWRLRGGSQADPWPARRRSSHAPLQGSHRSQVGTKMGFSSHTTNQDNDVQCEGRRTSSTCSSSSLGSWLASGSSAEMLSTRCTRFVVVNITLLLTFYLLIIFVALVLQIRFLPPTSSCSVPAGPSFLSSSPSSSTLDTCWLAF